MFGQSHRWATTVFRQWVVPTGKLRALVDLRPRMCTQPERAPTFRQRADSQAGLQAGPRHETGEGHGSTGPLPARS